MTPATVELIARFTRALGKPVATPEIVMAADYGETHRLERASYRVFRWGCPVCCAHLEDPQGLYRPLVIDSDGNVECNAAGCEPEKIALEIRDMIAVEALLDSLGAS